MCITYAYKQAHTRIHTYIFIHAKHINRFLKSNIFLFHLELCSQILNVFFFFFLTFQLLFLCWPLILSGNDWSAKLRFSPLDKLIDLHRPAEVTQSVPVDIRTMKRSKSNNNNNEKGIEYVLKILVRIYLNKPRCYKFNSIDYQIRFKEWHPKPLKWTRCRLKNTEGGLIRF